MTYEEYSRSEKRDHKPIMIDTIEGRTHIAYDRFFRLFILPESRQLITVEQFLDAFHAA